MFIPYTTCISEYRHSILTKICLHFDFTHCSFPILELWVCDSNLFSSILFFFVFTMEVTVEMYDCYDMPVASKKTGYQYKVIQ